MKDKEVKEKIEGLDALSGGIVYGKEEAWDKLQARMDKPAAKKIVFGYRWAAAAAVLLCICVIGFYFYPEKQVALNQPPDPTIITDTEHTVLSVPATTAPVVATTPQTHNVAIKKETQEVQFVIKEQPVIIVPELPKETVIPEPTAIVNTTAKPVMPSIKKMRVVHINDLGRPTGTAPEQAIVYNVYNGPALDISKMKVVSLYDIQREESVRKQEEEIMAIVRINRPHGGFFSVSNPFSRNNPDRAFAQNPFTIRLNRNN